MSSDRSDHRLHQRRRAYNLKQEVLPFFHAPQVRMQTTVRKIFFAALFLCLFLSTNVLSGIQVVTATVHPLASLPITRANFTLNKFLQQGNPYQSFDGLHVVPTSSLAAPQGANTASKAISAKSLPTAEPPKMHTASQKIELAVSGQSSLAGTRQSATPLHLIGSDTQGPRLEVVIPAGALDVSKVTTSKGAVPQGALTLTLSQLYGHYSTATNELGSFQLQVVDAQGQVLKGIQLHAPATLIIHYRSHELSNLSLNADKLYLIWSASDTTTASTVVPLQNNTATSTLTAQAPTLGLTPFVVTGADPIQTPPHANFASVQGNGGQLSYSYPLVVAPGPEGTMPQLAVSYSSESTNERHAPTTPANNVGEGWSLAVGSVSASKNPDGTIWYSISGVDNVSDLLIPDTTGNTFATEHISYLKVNKIMSANTGQTCFTIRDTQGNYFEFGCTIDALQYYIDSSGNRTNYRYDLDKMIPANEGPGTNGRNMTASYVQDQETSGGHTWIRDAALKQITYGNSINRIGTIDFFYNGPSNYTDPSSQIQYETQYTSTYETNCHLPTQSPQPQRCDDPIDRSNGLPDPDVMSTLSLQTIKSYIGDNNTISHLDYSYSFNYQDTAFGNCPTAATNLSTAYCAGDHLLTSITPTVYQNSTAHQLPGVTLGYSGRRKNGYDDSSQNAYHMENSWNYLTSYHDHSDGVGASAITYHTAYNNSHGTPNIAGDNRYDALFCINNVGSCNSGTSYYPMDDKMWTMQVVTQMTSVGQDSSASTLAPASTHYDYWLTQTQGSCPADTATPPNSDCVGFGWIPHSNIDWQDYYHGEFKGFGTVLTTSPAGDLAVEKYASTWGWDSPESDPRNYLAGQLLEEDMYQGSTINNANLLSKAVNTYAGQNGTQAACASTTTYPSTTYRPCEIMLLNDRTTVYEKTGSSNTSAPWVQNDYTYDDYTATGGLGDHHQAPATGSYHNVQQVVVTSANASTPLTEHMTYYTTDTTSGGSTYYNVHQLAHSDLVDASGHTWHCQDTKYDEGVANNVPTPAAGWPTTETTYSNCADQSSTAIKNYTGYTTFGDIVAAVDGVGTANPSLYTGSGTGCTLTTPPAIFTSTSNWGSGHYTSCVLHNNISSLPTDVWNAFGQSTHTGYDPTHGLVPVSTTNENGQISTSNYSYDSSGNSIVQVSQPGETGSYTAQSISKASCTDSSTLPCYEIDSNTSLYGQALIQSFYDGSGREVETLHQGPDATHTLVTFTIYNDQTHSVFESSPFVVSSRTTWLDPNGATDDTGAVPPGVATTFDAADRTLSITDSSSQQSSIVYGLGSVSGDSNTYAKSLSIDANNHVQEHYTDSLGHIRYVLDDSGSYGGSLSANTQFTSQYNALGETTSITVTDLAPQPGQTVVSVTTQDQYDDLGRLISRSDPDRGTHAYTYNADSAIVSDVSSNKTLGYSYDLLGRLGCLQDTVPTPDPHGACSAGTHPFVQNTYDADPSGVTWGSTNYSVGELTQSIATNYYPSPDNTQGLVTENMQHDQRGHLITERMQIATTGGTLAFPSFPVYQQALSYNDANQLTTTQTTIAGQPGYVFTQAYDSTNGNQVGLSNTSIGVPSLVALNYNSPQGQLSDIVFKDSAGANLANENLQYDGLLRLIKTSTTWQSGSNTGNTIYSDNISYDGVGNVTSRISNLAAVPGVSGSGGNDVQNYCYDEQNHLVWASNTTAATPAANQTCGSATPQGTIGNGYTNSFVYTHLGQLWQGPLNGKGTQEQYLYCNSGNPHQLTALAPTSNNPTCASPGTTDYSTSYDSGGNVTSRTYPANTTGSLVYDGRDQMVKWSSTTTTNNQGEWYMYDASGHRVLRRSASTASPNNPATAPSTITVYAFGMEEHAYQYTGSGSSATNSGNTYYYYLGEQLIGTLSGITTLSISFMLTDTLGSVISTISNTAGTATVLGNQEYGPYGNQLYSAGSSGTAKGFTGQYSDDLTGLDYYNARYYDPVVGRFLAADVVQGNQQGDDPYAYVSGNPETHGDPTGLCGMFDWGCIWNQHVVQPIQRAVAKIQRVVQQVVQVIQHVVHAVQHIVHAVQHITQSVQHMVNQVQVRVVVPLIHKVIKVVAAVVAVIVVAAVVVHIISRFAKASNPNKAIANKIRTDAQKQWNKITPPKTRSNTNYGGGFLTLTGKNDKALGGGIYSKPYSQFNAEAGATDAKGNPVPHTEELVVRWAQRQISAFRAANPDTEITSVKLIIYTFREPCGSCAANLNNGTWKKDLETSAGGAKVEIDVWTSYGKPNAPAVPWP